MIRFAIKSSKSRIGLGLEIQKEKGKRLMKILVIGAGVLGSLYAARRELGNQVTVLARGHRVQEVQQKSSFSKRVVAESALALTSR